MSTKEIGRFIQRGRQGTSPTHAEVRKASSELDAIRKAARTYVGLYDRGHCSAEDSAEMVATFRAIASEAP